MSIYKINNNLPISDKIEDLNDMILEINGKIEQGKFDKNEVDQIITDIGIDRKFLRNQSLGHTLATYGGWSHLHAESGYSIWKYSPTYYTYDALNELYFDNKAYENRGEANSESDTTFLRVYLYNGDSGTGYLNHTTEAYSEDGVSFKIIDSSLDYLYVGLASTFAGVAFEWATRGANYTLDAEYWTGSVWATLDVSSATYVDDTSNFESDGRIYWTIPTLWATTTINTTSAYWIRFSTSTEPTTTAEAYKITPANSVISLLQLSSTEILEEDWAWCSYGTSIYVTVRNTGVSNYEGSYFVTSASSALNKQNYFINNHEFTADYKDSTYVATTFTYTNLNVSNNLTVGNDLTITDKVSIGTSTISPRLYVYEPTTGNEVVRFASPTDFSGTTNEVNFSIYQNSIVTYDGNYGNLHVFTLEDNTTYFFVAYVVGRRTGGGSGSAGDSAAYTASACYKRTAAGIAVQVGTQDTDVILENQSNFTVIFEEQDNDVQLQVRGAASNTVLWHATITVQKVSA